jgi:hypothetical protein
MKVLTYAPVEIDAADFVRLWSARYDYRLGAEYEHHLVRPLTRDALKELFKWKNGRRLSQNKQKSIEDHYLCHVAKLNALAPDTTAADFLNLFGGGPIWRIFLLHCWSPSRFPIYDQHVHRAMKYMRDGNPSEIASSTSEVVRSYLEEYLPFHRRFADLNQREVDRALWAFGKFLEQRKGAESQTKSNRCNARP